MKGVNLPLISVENIKGNPNIKSTRVILPSRKSKSVVKVKLDPYAGMNESYANDNITINEFSVPPRRFVDKKMKPSDSMITTRRNVRVSSRTEEYDADKLSYRLVKNKINHLEYRPELFKPYAINHIKKVIS